MSEESLEDGPPPVRPSFRARQRHPWLNDSYIFRSSLVFAREPVALAPPSTTHPIPLNTYRDNINTLSFGDGNPSAAGAANPPSPPTPPPFLPRGQQQHHGRPQDV